MQPHHCSMWELHHLILALFPKPMEVGVQTHSSHNRRHPTRLRLIQTRGPQIQGPISTVLTSQCPLPTLPKQLRPRLRLQIMSVVVTISRRIRILFTPNRQLLHRLMRKRRITRPRLVSNRLLTNQPLNRIQQIPVRRRISNNGESIGLYN
ncbi:hypothetical protein P879_10469 [Paragonimus westermani]|uniref:Uncharacterized protein n=1 Tax=Paragonimus westermani TaxID=34504 RepID=A0A8T0DN49_9TREM|nr:hypothetical protein P879_10469 [Paragonimus westermani]